jgi:uncharacterized membrane protein
MKWYSRAAKRVGKGIVLFLFPIMLLIFIFGKAIKIVQSIILPIKTHLPAERIFGIGILSLISLILILLVCYIAGMLTESKKVKSFLSLLENNLLIFIPGYAMIKSGARDAIGDNDNEWKVVMIAEDDEWKFGIEVDKQPDGYSTIFFPEPPDAKSGEMKMIHESKLKRINLPVSKLVNVIRNYGRGAGDLVK